MPPRNRNREKHFDRLFEVSATGSWEPWLLFFQRGVRSRAREAFVRSRELYERHSEYRERYQASKSETIPQLIDLLFSRPVLSVRKATEEIGDKTYQAVNNSVARLEGDGILVEVTGRSQNRLFQATEILTVIHKPLDELQDVGEDRDRQAELVEYRDET